MGIDLKFILVGNGSMGSRYSNYLSNNICDISEICIIDNKKSVLNNLKERGFICYDSLSKLSDINDCTYGIVANWGPDHLTTAEELILLGCKRLIIEKPISNNLEELIRFKKKYESNIFITVHHFFRYTSFLNDFRNAEKKYNFGEPIGIRLSGGAVCLSTSGTHYLDLSCQILDSEPLSASADLEIDYINPRDNSLAYIGGSVSYRMENGTFIHVSFFNKSSQSLRTEVIYKHGVIEIDAKDDKFIFYKRKPQDIEKFGNIITRHGKNYLIGEESFEFDDTVQYVINNLMFGEKPLTSISVAERSLRMILAAVQSNQEEKKINLNTIRDTGLRIS